MADYRPLLVDRFGGRRVVLGSGPLASYTRLIARLGDLGAGPFFLVASGIGTGPLPSESDATWVVVDEPIAADLVEETHTTEAMLAAPPAAVVAAVDGFDPNGEALVYFDPVCAAATLGDRPAYAPRRPEWIALEDKTTVDGLFDAAGVPRPPGEVVAVDGAALAAAHARLDRGEGTVWSGDARLGFNGGAAYVRWVTDDTEAASAVAFFAGRCHRVRVSPFLDGIPCSVHAFVADDGIAVFRPAEMVVLRDVAHHRFVYAGAATFWDAPAADGDAMRHAARAVAALLRERVAYRGALTVDGVMTAGGFQATEVNPRWGAGLNYTAAALPDLHLDLLHRLVVAGDAPGVRAADLEAMVLEASLRVRATHTHTLIKAAWSATVTTPLRDTGDGYERVTDGDPEPPDATLVCGPAGTGGLARVLFDQARVAPGPPLAPRVARALEAADRLHGAGIGRLEAAPEVRH